MGGGSREDVVHADDAVRSGGAAVMDDGGVALHPHPAPVLGEHAVILSGDLTLHQHCRETYTSGSEKENSLTSEPHTNRGGYRATRLESCLWVQVSPSAASGSVST